MNDIIFSVVIPVYNSEQSLVELFARLHSVFEQMEKSFEVIFINDASRDNSLNVLLELKRSSNKIIIIDLFKNSGQQNALMCGFNYCKGDYIITIDDDLQNPPEEIPSLFHKIQEGYDAVFGYYDKKNHNKYKNIGSLIIRKLNHPIFDVKDIKFSSFRIIKKEIINEIKDIRTPFPYISGMLVTTTSNIANQLIDHRERPMENRTIQSGS